MFWLNRQLKRLRQSANPSREFRAGLWSKLSHEMEAHTPVHRPMWRYATMGICTIALFFGTGMGVYAYESPDVSVGHPLFGLKRGMEQVEGQFAQSPEARARFHGKMVGRRLREAQRAIHRRENVDLILGMAADELGMTIDELKTEIRDPETREAILDDLVESNERYAEILEGVGEGGQRFRRPLPPEIREMIRELRDPNSPTY